MNTFAVVVLCLQACLIQNVFGQCTSRAAVAADPGLIAPGLAAGYGFPGPTLAAPYGISGPVPYDIVPCPGVDFTPTFGGVLAVSSSSAIPPVGISIASDNIYEGCLSVAGELPFVGTVAVDGVVPSAGSGAVDHDCGNGVNAMVSEGAAFAPGYPGPYAPAAAIAPGYAAPGYRGGWAGRGCGCAI